MHEETFFLQNESGNSHEGIFILRDGKIILHAERFLLQEEFFILQNGSSILSNERFFVHEDFFRMQNEKASEQFGRR
ncbi:MAG: hypothetical protein EA377_04840 [Phycisphaerales bacterium]|nr:MAG: hypothetical protein EA377_04840 [Phycisphaerales bacterium]